ncbi:FAAH2 hydrolase, partial [Acromyrmex heyeri]
MLWKIRIVFTIVNVIYNVLRPIWLFFHKKPPSIPPITRPIYMLSATKLAKKIREGEITSSEVVREYIKRINEVNSFINAVVDERFADAIIEATNYDQQLKEGKFDIKTLEKEKPLYGVPITIKECCAVKGCSHTGCTLPCKGIKADYDAAIVEMLRNAGAIPLCVTNTPEMCGGFDSTNLLYGRTCNPYDTRYSAGGSSGGEKFLFKGALLGAGGSVIGIGSDFAGSIRIPAFMNGIFGHKPTSGIIPTNGHFPFTEDKYFHKFLTFGPMTRYAEDLGLLMKVMTSKCNHDLRLDVPVDLKQIKIYYRQSLDKTIGVLSMSQEIENCVLKAANHFARYNVRAEKVQYLQLIYQCTQDLTYLILQLPIEWPVTIIDIGLTGFLNVKKPPQMVLDASDPKHHKNLNVEMMKALFGLSEHTKQLLFFTLSFETHFPFTESEISHYTKHTGKIRQKLLDLLGDNGVLIYPTFRKQFLPQFVLCEIMSVTNCAIFNLIGFPAAHVPMGLNLHEGMPIGIQVNFN